MIMYLKNLTCWSNTLASKIYLWIVTNLKLWNMYSLNRLTDDTAIKQEWYALIILNLNQSKLNCSMFYK